MRRLVLGTAGHIDHGKTSLVKALTGVDLDRLKEEKARGITIELGFTQLTLPDGTQLGFVDVPGHEKFVRTMIAGASGIDLVALVIAADEGVMPQTREHLDVCSLLGVRDGLVVLNKIDAVDGAMADLAEEDAAATVAGTFLEGRPIVRFSARTGAGLAELGAAISAAANRVQERGYRGPFRMSVDRAFAMKGFGTVVTGTAAGGRVQPGDVLSVFPGGASGRVRGVQVHGKDEPFALAGQRTAINLPSLEREQVPRGSVLFAAGALSPSYLLDVEYRHLPSAGKLKPKRVRFLSGTQEVAGNLVVFGDAIAPGETRFAQLRLEEPVAVRSGDRFVLRHHSPMVTVGGGRVLDSHPRKRKAKAKDDSAALHFASLAGDSPEARALALIADGGPLGVASSELALRLPPGESEDANATARALVKSGAAEILDGADRVLSRAAYDAIAGAALEALREFHRTNPSKDGLPRAELAAAAARAASAGGPTAAPVAEAILRRLESTKKLATAASGELKLPGHVAKLDAAASDLRPAIEETYRSAGLQPPTVKELTDKHSTRSKEVQSVLSLLHREGALVKVSQDLFFHKEPLAALQQRLVDHLKAKAKIAPLEFKELAGNISRKFMIPLLEHFDAQKVTMRVGEERVLRKKD